MAGPVATAAAMLRERQVLELRAACVSFEDIGAQIGCSAGRVRHIVSRAYKRAPHPHAEVLREEQNRQLDRLQRALWPQALGLPERPASDGSRLPAVPADPAAVREVRRLMERRARLNGLDAPVKVSAEVTFITEDSVDAEIRMLVAELNARGVTDGDVAEGGDPEGPGSGLETAAPPEASASV